MKQKVRYEVRYIVSFHSNVHLRAKFVFIGDVDSFFAVIVFTFRLDNCFVCTQSASLRTKQLL